MPNFNGEHFLPGALDALLAQSYRPLEILVLDDGSTDASVELLERYARAEPSLRVLRHEINRGAVEALLSLTEAAQGSHVYFAAVDDVVLPGLLERSMEMLERHPGAGFCASLSRTMDEQGRDQGIFPSPVVARKPAFLSPATVRRLLPWGLLDWFVLGNTTVYARDAVRDTGRPCSGLGPYWDGFMSQLIALEHGACFIPEPLASWRLAAGSYSGQLRADPSRVGKVADEAYRLMTEEYHDLFPEGYADAWRREVRIQSEDELASGPKLTRLRREAALRRRHGLPVWPAAARRLRVRRDALRRKRIEARQRGGDAAPR